MKICGLQKVTLLDFPNLVACTIFTKGCDFKCPFCQNSSLIPFEDDDSIIDEEEIMNFLKKRKGIIDGICITGGEPTLQKDLKDFIIKVRNLGYKVKLDTNGYFPSIVKSLVNEGLIDYVAMDIKNSFTHYKEAGGVKNLDLSRIKETIDFLKEGHVDYEFRTTVVKELHDLDDFKEIATMLKGARRYYLQQFRDSPSNLVQNLHAHTKEDLEKFRQVMLDAGIKTELRGID